MGKVKWDSIADQTLLAKILETHDLSVDVAKVAEAWPVEDEDHRPTPRALKERLNKIRENVRNGNVAAVSGPSSPVTPKKRAPRKKANETPTPAGSSRKRKRVTKNAIADEDQVNVREEEELPAKHEHSLDESTTKQEAGLEGLAPLLQWNLKEGSPDVDNKKVDPEWTEYNEEDAYSDDQLN
ncbi:hypothetical protein DTO013E5_4365 [Penicillium roqueforti]|nr:hypothetical protein DTO012A1_7565 [Penicillium roqueforti]KAI2737782.1 hypothetical protein DTO013F2_9714 [Penicillium roqueforti]KAI3180192.1 hypothetical protein DTO046C5_1428 [Penicillium roqueforti]KAI3213072.1 hypothetical protein DTO013E5_4365 [Penicillium roqueforti]